MVFSGRIPFLVGLCLCLMLQNVALCANYDYAAALTKSLLYFEGQRSGKLPSDQRLQWRADSGLKDGQDTKVDLVGGYYDAGDNLKLGFPMAFTITMLSWSTIEFKEKLEAKRELSNALKAIKWGTDYLMKAHNQPRVLYGQVGDVASDHACWQRPEDMTTPRTTFHLDDKSPGSDLAAETAAALAAASIAFRPVDDSYATQLLHHAIDLFAFAVDKPGLYQDSFKASAHAYSSSGYDDEMVWAAAWLERASGDHMYMDYISRHGHGGLRQTFCWDDKYVGAQILVAKIVLDGKVQGGVWEEYKEQAEKFICACAQKGGGSNVKMTRGGLLWFLPWDNIQYVATATFSLSLYAKYLDTYHQPNIKCQDATLTSADLTAFVKSQVDYILGSNPKNMSYMVGYGSKYPQKIHHRAASIIPFKKDPTPVTCKGGYDKWFQSNNPNPNVLEGAMVSCDEADNYDDSRPDYQTGEPTTVTNGPFVGVFAHIA